MSLIQSAAALAAFVACGALVACSSSSDPTIATKPSNATTTPAPSTPAGDISVFPDEVYVGVDETGKALSSAPIGLTGGAGTVSWTSSNADIAAASGNLKSGEIAPVKPGTSTVTVKDGTKSVTISVTVLMYQAADVVKGQTEFGAANCAGCHGPTGPDISPSGVGKHTDDQVFAAATEGKNPEGGDLAVVHKYTATKAIVAYLRSIPAQTDTPIKDD